MTVPVATTLDLGDAEAVERRKRALRASSFEYSGRSFPYHVDGGNKPFDNERAVELAIAERALREHDPGVVLEVGNVLSHYFPTSHSVLDKFETHRAVTWNEDVLTFVPPFAPALIISVSTLEHVGHVERPPDRTGFSRAVASLLRWLRPGGELLITVPLGYNPSVLALLEDPAQPFDELVAMKRVSEGNEWVQTTLSDVRDVRYGQPFPCGNAIVIARARKPGSPAPAGSAAATADDAGSSAGAVAPAAVTSSAATDPTTVTPAASTGEGGAAPTADATYSEDGAVPSAEAITSADLKEVYDRRYYGRMAGGAVHERQGHLRELPNIWRAAALVLNPQLRNATDVGSGRGELAHHLIAGGTRVTLLDYAEPAIAIAREYVGENPLASYVVGDATRLSEYVRPGSQDAVFMTDVVEHISTPELRVIFEQIRQVLAPGGILIVHTPEKYRGTVSTTSAVQGMHINLFEIDTLRNLLAETFDYADAFTWNGVERFASRGKCIELFGIGRDAAYAVDHHPERETMSTSQVRLVADRAGAWSTVVLIDHPRLPSRFVLRFDLEILRSASDAKFHVLLRDAEGATVAWTGLPLSAFLDSPADLFLASETFNRVVPGNAWTNVASVAVRTLYKEGTPVELRVTDVRVLHA